MKIFNLVRTSQSGVAPTSPDAMHVRHAFSSGLFMLFCFVVLAAIAAATSPLHGNEKTEIAASSPLSPQEMTRRMLALIGDIHAVNDVSADLIARHFGQLDPDRPEQANTHGLTRKLTDEWYFHLRSQTPKPPGSDYGAILLQLARIGDDTGDDMSAACVGINDFRIPLIAAGFKERAAWITFNAPLGQELSRGNTTVTVRLKGRTGAKDPLGCVAGVLIDVGMKDDSMASWRQLAEQGEGVAQFELGVAYADGRGVKQDCGEAASWLNKARIDHATRPMADFELAMLYETGCGVARDDARAAELYRESATRLALSAYRLGRMYAEGRGVGQDEGKALALLRQAADRGYGVADAEGVAWWRKLAEGGNAGAQSVVGDIYRDGTGVGRDDVQAVTWYRKAADQGDSVAQLALGRMYAEGRGVAADDAQAVAWFRKAIAKGPSWFDNAYLRRGIPDDIAAVAWWHKTAEAGLVGAQYVLGTMYRDGKGEKRDASKAALWLRRAAVSGDAEAQFALGSLYRQIHSLTLPAMLQFDALDSDRNDPVEWLTRAADQGHAGAQLALGEIDGARPGQDNQAADWFRKAADQGNAIAETRLGWAYARGRGVARDDEQAVTWYRKAAEQDCPACAWAQRNLASMYVSGQGVAKDYAKAVDWYRKAAKHHDVNAKYNLGVAYRDGLGVGADALKAAAWFKASSKAYRPSDYNFETMYPLGAGAAHDKTEQVRASARFGLGWIRGDGSSKNLNASEVVPLLREAVAGDGDAAAQFIFGSMYRNRDKRGASVPHDDAEAVRWYRKAADQGYPPAQYALGKMSRDGEGMTRDDTQAAAWYEKAAVQGHARAQFALSQMYRDGLGVSKDEAQATQWLRMAREQGVLDENIAVQPSRKPDEAFDHVRDIATKGDADAQVELGMMFMDGRSGRVNDGLAAEWLKKPAQQGNVKAQYQLGRLYKGWISADGHDVAYYDGQAVLWFRKAAEQGNADAQYYLGIACRDGEGTGRDAAQAVAWFAKAADQGQTAARDALALMRAQGSGTGEPTR